MEKRIEESLWKKSVEIASRSVLETDIETDVAVIGGGLAGILTAYFLEQAGRKCIVLEADHIGSGQTANTTAKVTSARVQNRIFWLQIGGGCVQSRSCLRVTIHLCLDRAIIFCGCIRREVL